MRFKNMMIPVAAVMAAGMLVAECARASAVPTILMGTQSIDVNGTIDDDGEDLGINMVGRYGYFIEDLIRGGGYGTIEMIGDFKRVGGGVFGEYNFDMGTELVPFVGGSGGLGWADDGNESKTYAEVSGFGGARYFFVDYAAIGAQLNLFLATQDI
ncbi:MAG TPA: hypothetical protein DCS43_02395 [Verrucomicrobia bacterium]|nr:hypothetical protein [Verrucomicrobiota bacterium]